MKTRALTENELGMLCENCQERHASIVSVDACTAFCSTCFKAEETWQQEYFADVKARKAREAWAAAQEDIL